MTEEQSAYRNEAPAPLHRRLGQAAVLSVCVGIYFFVVCLTASATVKTMALTLTILAVAAAVLWHATLRDRLRIPLFLLFAVVFVDGISTLYAVSGKFALYEFLKVLSGFSMAMLLLALAPGEGQTVGRWAAKLLSGFSALAGLVSIDLLSTRMFSGLILSVLERFTQDYQGLDGVEAGIRMLSLFRNPNVFAGIAGLGALLSLGIICSSETRWERTAQTAVLYVNALSFLLVFSMGATAAIAVAFVAILILERTEKRVYLFLLMAETLVCSVLSAGVISATSFQQWDGVQSVPVLCTFFAATALCLLDRFVGEPLAKRLEKMGKWLPALLLTVLVGMVAFIVLACSLTAPVTLQPGDWLRRAAYPEAGAYQLSIDSEASLSVTIESQDQSETMMHTGTILFQGEASEASFTVPDGSLVAYFTFYAPDGGELREASYEGADGVQQIPLGYPLLPGFVSNRLQGLWANENAIQRLVFFADGLKLFQRNPVVGLGMGAFENGIKSVQSFRYETKYAHNHYIQMLVETGIVGLALFAVLLAGSFAVIFTERRREDHHPLIPALGAALVFMAGHAAVELVFSFYAYIPMAFGIFALLSLCCSETSPKRPRLVRAGRSTALLVMCGLMIGYSFLLGGNMRARTVKQTENTMEGLEKAISMDRFEWADYAVSYVGRAPAAEEDSSIRQKADQYAERLAELDSNTVPIYLASYYFQTDRPEQGFAMAEKYVTYVSSDPSAWESAFIVMELYVRDEPAYREGVLRIADLLEERNRTSMDQITLSAKAQSFIAAMAG